MTQDVGPGWEDVHGGTRLGGMLGTLIQPFPLGPPINIGYKLLIGYRTGWVSTATGHFRGALLCNIITNVMVAHTNRTDMPQTVATACPVPGLGGFLAGGALLDSVKVDELKCFTVAPGVGPAVGAVKISDIIWLGMHLIGMGIVGRLGFVAFLCGDKMPNLGIPSDSTI